MKSTQEYHFIKPEKLVAYYWYLSFVNSHQNIYFISLNNIFNVWLISFALSTIHLQETSLWYFHTRLSWVTESFGVTDNWIRISSIYMISMLNIIHGIVFLQACLSTTLSHTLLTTNALFLIAYWSKAWINNMMLWQKFYLNCAKYLNH